MYELSKRMQSLRTCKQCEHMQNQHMKTFYGLANSKNPKELPYVMGVLLGDACIYRMKATHYMTGKPSFTWRIDMSVIDKEFAERFAYSCGMILKRPERRNVHAYSAKARNKAGKKMYRVCVASASFGEWWTKLSWPKRLKFALKHPANFLRGMYDSEGSLSQMNNGRSFVARIFTTNHKTAFVVNQCLIKLGLRGVTRVFRKRGRRTNFGVSNYDLLVIIPRPSRKFLQLVGSSIPRKNLP